GRCGCQCRGFQCFGFQRCGKRAGSRCSGVSADGWGGGELSYRAESRDAGEAIGGDGWAVLETGGVGEAAQRDLLFGGWDLGSGYEGVVGYAGGVSTAAGVDGRGLVAAAEVGGGMRALVCAAMLFAALGLGRAYAAVYYVTVAGLGGE